MALIWTSLLIFLNVLFVVILYYRRKRLPGEPPLKNCPIPFVGGAVNFGCDPVNYLKSLQKDLGDVFSLRMAGWNYTVIMNPSDINCIARCKNLNQNPIIGDFVTRMFGQEHSFHNQEKPVHEDISSFRERNKAVPRAIKDNLRGPSQVENLYQSCVQNTVKIIKQMKEGKIHSFQENNTVKLHELCQDLVYYLSHNILMGSLPNEEENLKEAKKLYAMFSKFNKNSALLLDRIPIHFLPATKNARSKIIEFLRGMSLENREHVPDMTLEMLNSDTNKENQIRHLMLMLWTGQANTTPALFWSLFYILKHPEVKQQILEEFKNLMQEINQEKSSRKNTSEFDINDVTLDDIAQIGKSDLNKLVIFDAVLMEVLRITGSNMNVRRATADTVFKTHDNKQYKIRKGDYTLYYTPIMHFDPEIYEEPEKFKFDRFLKNATFNQTKGSRESMESKTNPSKEESGSRTILTFGFGGGRCPGRHLALMKIKLMILSLLTCFDPKLLTEHIPKADLSHIGYGVMPPESDVIMSLSPGSTKKFNF